MFDRLLMTAALTGALCAPALADYAPWRVCGFAKRIDCIVDGDTLWRDGVKYRIADIDAPEAADKAHCERERALSDEATYKLKSLLDTGGLIFSPQGFDQYGRTLVLIQTRAGSVSTEMINAGLATPFKRGKPDRLRWCR